MNKLVLTPHFRKAYKRIVRRFPFLLEQIDQSILLLEKDIHDPKLKTHKLSGDLIGCMACTCGYDCRIIFVIKGEVVLLITIGTHDEVY